MRKNTAAAALVFVGALVLLCLAALAFQVHMADSRGAYRTLSPSDYHPSFFRDYRLAQAQKAAWLGNALEVASRYAGATQPCMVSTVKSLPASEGQAVFVFENKCQAGVFAARKRRVELARRDGVWEIAWTGVTFKCWGNPSEPGTYLVSHNPFRRSGTPSAALVNAAVKDIGYTLNPWHGQCPP